MEHDSSRAAIEISHEEDSEVKHVIVIIHDLCVWIHIIDGIHVIAVPSRAIMK